MNSYKFSKIIFSIMLILACQLPSFSAKKNAELIEMPKTYPAKYTSQYIKQIAPIYKSTGKEEVIYVALDMLKGTNGEFSRNAILGNNLSGRAVKVEFRDLGTINPDYANFDALGWKKNRQLFIFINPRHKDAPPGALAALLAHEALHQDEYNSIAEETYAWTMEASVWYEISKIYPESNEELHPLVVRENTLKKLFVRGNYSSKYIRKSVVSNPGYKNLPSSSPGFEDL